MWLFPKIKLLLFSADYSSSVLSEAEEFWMLQIRFKCSSIAFSSSSSLSSFLISHLKEKSHLSIFITSKLQSTLSCSRLEYVYSLVYWGVCFSLFVFYRLLLGQHNSLALLLHSGPGERETKIVKPALFQGKVLKYCFKWGFCSSSFFKKKVYGWPVYTCI